MFFQKKKEVIFIMDEMWLIFIGLGKLPTNFQRHARSHLVLPYQNNNVNFTSKVIYLAIQICNRMNL